MDDRKQKNEENQTNTKDPKYSSISLLKKPNIPYYEHLPDPLLSNSNRPDASVKNDRLPGFEEFRKYKKVNESRIITPYKAEDRRLSKPGIKVFPKIEIEDADKFLIEKIKDIPVKSLESLLQLIHNHQDIRFLTMNRYHMDLINDYQPYGYTICNHNIDKSNYVTISPNGLLEIYKGDADFMPLERLMVEYQLYHSLREIPMFTSFRFCKAFMVWLEKIRRRKFIEAKSKMETFFVKKLNADRNLHQKVSM